MASEVTEAERHVQILQTICRICGDKLKKSKALYENSYSCQQRKDFIQNRFNLDVQNEDHSIFPPRFCNVCNTTTRKITPCRGSHIPPTIATLVCLQKKWPKEVNIPNEKKGRKPFKSSDNPNPSTSQSGQSSADLLTELKSLRAQLEPKSYRGPNFLQNFELGDVDDKFKQSITCPLCLEIPDKPVKTKRMHVFCLDGIERQVEVGEKKTCPCCKQDLAGENAIPPVTYMVFEAISSAKIKCKNCTQAIRLEHSLTHDVVRAPMPLTSPMRLGLLPLPFLVLMRQNRRFWRRL